LRIAAIANSIYAATKNVSKINLTINQSAAAAERIVEFLDTPASIQDPVNPIPLQRIQDKIEIDHITFAYEEKPALIDFSLQIHAGDKVALVGRSGSGKSTLINLLMRFYDPQQGEIRLDGIPLPKASLADLRDQIGLVSQDIILFNDTIASNIGLGKLNAPREEIIEAARRAYADEFIRALPQGYETHVGEKGTRLSGGQRQRIAIARAFIRDPAILILDEATSALDSESERLVMKAFDELMSGRTAIVIAHRLSTIQNADRIVVLQEGHLAETGSHFELLARNGVYKRLYDQQALTSLDDHGNPPSHSASNPTLSGVP
jgi:subfamily B ATP-binding cassette protein MsbA